MATYYARKTGNINAADVWATTPTGTAAAVTFDPSDILVSNSFTITVNVSVSVTDVRSDGTGGATQGGTFNLQSGVTLTANVVAGTTNATIVGSVTGGAGTGGSAAAANSGPGTLNIIGTITGGSGNNSRGVANSSAGTINITGNVIGPNATNAYGVLESVGTTNITGNVTGGGVANSAYGAYLGGVGNISIVGTCTGGTAGPGFYNNSNGTASIKRAKGNGYGVGSVGLSAAAGVVNAVQVGNISVTEIEYGDLGQSPTIGPISFVNTSGNLAIFYVSGAAKKTLIDAASTINFPISSDVRNGTTYNFGSNVGSCVIPPSSSVSYGVAVDSGSGIAALSPNHLYNILTSNISASNSIGMRLKNVSTIAGVGSQISSIRT